MIFRKCFARLTLLPVLASPLAVLAAPPLYTVAFAPANFQASKINNHGQVVGTAGEHPAIWYRNRITTIDAVRGIGLAIINNRGEISGRSPKPGDDLQTTGFVYGRAGVRYITLDAFKENVEAVGINDGGQVIGMGFALYGERAQGFVESRRGARLIDTFGGEWSYVSSVNNAGYVVGVAAFSDSTVAWLHAQAFVYRNGVQRDLGTLGGLNSAAWDINDVGQVVGDSDTVLANDYENTPSHAFLWERGNMRDLGTLGGDYSRALAINNTGVVVGDASAAGDPSPVAFVYARGKMTDLNKGVRLAEGWVLTSATDINDAGQILARACKLEDCHWARLTPLRNAPSGAQPATAGAGVSEGASAN